MKDKLVKIFEDEYREILAGKPSSPYKLKLDMILYEEVIKNNKVIILSGSEGEQRGYIVKDNNTPIGYKEIKDGVGFH